MKRRSSSIADLVTEASFLSLSVCSGFSSRARVLLPIRLTVVSWPAMSSKDHREEFISVHLIACFLSSPARSPNHLADPNRGQRPFWHSQRPTLCYLWNMSFRLVLPVFLASASLLIAADEAERKRLACTRVHYIRYEYRVPTGDSIRCSQPLMSPRTLRKNIRSSCSERCTRSLPTGWITIVSTLDRRTLAPARSRLSFTIRASSVIRHNLTLRVARSNGKDDSDHWRVGLYRL